MTCRHTHSLLEDYVDSEVDLATAESLKAHLLECDECRAEVESSAILKSMIKGLSRPDPGDEYWDEVSRLILARTVEGEAPPSPVYQRVPVSASREARQTLMRSVASVAFSLVVLLGAIWLGSQRHNGTFVVQTPTKEFLVAASINPLTIPTDEIYTARERAKLAGAVSLLGPPVHGRMGEFACLLLAK